MVQVAASKRDGAQLREKPQQIADELRALIVSGKLTEGESLGREPELVGDLLRFLAQLSPVALAGSHLNRPASRGRNIWRLPRRGSAVHK